MSTEPQVGVKACVFDAYGTLFDFASAAKACRDVLGDGIDKLTALWRGKQLQYTWLRALQDQHVDFWQVTGDGLDFALQTLAMGLRDRLMNLYLMLDAFPEVADVLTRLKEAGLQTAILSNGSPKMLAAAVKAAKLDTLLDAVLSVETVGVYKPHPKVYQLAVDRSAAAIAYQSSNAWDAYAASAFGMQVVWCNRYGQQPERLPGKPDRSIGSLAELPEAGRRECMRRKKGMLDYAMRGLGSAHACARYPMVCHAARSISCSLSEPYSI
jgi:2-haloacid dehalogenase